ncbi:predicted protein [Histoplasma mississippiense (nom. inval.)]|uniref:predicted protein n=1 Tax=Ajellomyces capsulatus (strain NAm1 / WU24) TaxID=2059318 RepID=UPI000157D4BB|nr:predicted protein [Histoplasma mississippiense (nom. inval.)]EDN05094.1 predicted protein [Histoplasma mississippiense (nom. inval.)]
MARHGMSHTYAFVCFCLKSCEPSIWHPSQNQTLRTDVQRINEHRRHYGALAATWPRNEQCTVQLTGYPSTANGSQQTRRLLAWLFPLTVSAGCAAWGLGDRTENPKTPKVVSLPHQESSIVLGGIPLVEAWRPAIWQQFKSAGRNAPELAPIHARPSQRPKAVCSIERPTNYGSPTTALGVGGRFPQSIPSASDPGLHTTCCYSHNIKPKRDPSLAL